MWLPVCYFLSNNNLRLLYTRPNVMKFLDELWSMREDGVGYKLIHWLFCAPSGPGLGLHFPFFQPKKSTSNLFIYSSGFIRTTGFQTSRFFTRPVTLWCWLGRLWRLWNLSYGNLLRQMVQLSPASPDDSSGSSDIDMGTDRWTCMWKTFRFLVDFCTWN